MGLTRIRAEQISDIDYKQAVRVIQRTNITLSGGAPSSVDSVNLSANDRILVSGQDAAAENGIYRVQTLGQGENGTWVRTSDANADGEIEAGMIIMVTEGDVYKDTQWKLTTNNPIIIGTTPLTFVLNAVSVIGGENTQVQYNQSGVLAGSANLTFDGSSLAVGGNVSATYFVGNGSALTGISTSTDRIFSGDSNVDIATANADITMSVNGTANVVVVSTGLATVDGNVSANYFLGNGSQLTGIQAGAVTTVANAAPIGPAQGDIWINTDTGVQYIYFTSGGNSQWAEMEADQSFSTGGSSVDLTAVNTDILPVANITYDIGNTTNRFRDIYLANSTIYLGEASISAEGANLTLPATVTVGNAVLSESGGVLALPSGTTVGGSAAEVPKIGNVQITDSAWTVLDDTAISTDGGYFIINGSGFQSGATVSIDGTIASSVSFVDSTLLRCQIGAKAANSYTVYVVNPDGGTALKIAGLTYSGTPVWVTASQLANAVANTAFTYTLEATGATSYALAPGNSIPTGSTLAANGVFSGNVAVNNSTAYSFTVIATDNELQDSNRTFSLNVNLVTNTPQVEALIVAGGGGGGLAGQGGGGGGAGGAVYETVNITGGQIYTVVVGNGGQGSASRYSGVLYNGGNSSFTGATVAVGGGGGSSADSGQNYGSPGGNGGSGGGAAQRNNTNGGTGIAGQGYNGGRAAVSTGGDAGGGGGGAGGPGTSAPGANEGGNGGAGTSSYSSFLTDAQAGVDVGGTRYIAGGGGGAGGSTFGSGGLGGGGAAQTTNGTAGTSNTGGGGGGTNNGSGGAGGSGIVIIRYPSTYPVAVSTTGDPTVIVTNGYRYYKWTTVGTHSITF